MTLIKVLTTTMMLITANSAVASQLPKFVGRDDRSQNVLSINAAILQTATQSIPFVATTEIDSTTVYWWDANSGKWLWWERFHSPPGEMVPNAIGLLDANWSTEVCVVAGNNRVYLVYQRRPLSTDGSNLAWPDGPHLYLDVLEWSEVEQRVNTPDQDEPPLQIPLSIVDIDDIGMPLWAGWDNYNGRLLILIQNVMSTIRFDTIPGSNGRPDFYPDVELDLNLDMPGFPPIGPLALPLREPTLPEGIPQEALDTGSSATVPLLSFTPTESLDGSYVLDPEFDPGSIVTYEALETSLVLLSLPPDPASIANGDGWRTPLTVGIGGYAPDAVLDSGWLHVVFRPEPYAATTAPLIEQPFGEWIGSFDYEEGDQVAKFTPLRYRRVDLTTLEILPEDSLDDIPGGDFPQIQSVDPLVISSDVILEGEYSVDTTRTNWGYGRNEEPITPRVANESLWRASKVLSIYDKERTPSWSTANLFSYDPGERPRPIKMDGIPDFVASKDFSRGSITASRSFRPIFLIGWSTGQGGNQGKVRRAKFLMQALRGDGIRGLNKREILAVVSFDLPISPADEGSSTAIAESWGLVDYSHTQIALDDWTASENVNWVLGGDNRQFEPLTHSLNDEVHPVANTIGGNLSLVKKSEKPKLVAYTDMGDGGLRVIFTGDDLSQETPNGPEKGSVLRADDASGLDLQDAKSVSLPLGGWQDAGLPNYIVVPMLSDGNLITITGSSTKDPGSLGAFIHPPIDSVIYYTNFFDSSISVDPFVFSQEVNNNLQKSMSSSGDGNVSYFEGPPGPPLARFRISGRSFFTTDTMDIDARTSLGGPFSLTTFEWKLKGPLTWVHLTPDGEDELRPDAEDELQRPHWDGPEAEVPPALVGSSIAGDIPVMYRPGRYELQLTVGNANASSSHSELVEVTVGDVTAAPRNLHVGSVNPSLASPTVELAWDPPDDSLGVPPLEFSILRKDLDDGVGDYQLIGTSSVGSFSDSSVQLGKRYKYTVRAGGLSGVDPEIAPEVLILAGTSNISNLNGRHLGHSVELNWDHDVSAVGPSVQGYHIYQGLRGLSEFHLIDTVNTTRFTDTRWNVRSRHEITYLVAPVYSPSATSSIEGTWSRAINVNYEPSFTPSLVQLTEDQGEITLTWQRPLNPTAVISGYRVYRQDYGTGAASPFSEISSGVLNQLIFVDDSASEGAKYSYVVTAENGEPAQGTATGQFFVNELWSPLWKTHSDFASSDDSGVSFKIKNCTMTVGKYELSYSLSSPGLVPVVLENGLPSLEVAYTNRKVEIRTLDYWNTQFRLLDNAIDYRFLIRFFSEDISISPPASFLVDVNKVDVTLSYAQKFTLAPMMTGQRSLYAPFDVHSLIQGVGPDRRRHSILSAKPLEASRLAAEKVNVSISLTWFGIIGVSFVTLLISLGLGALATIISSYLAGLASGNPIVVAAALLFLTAVAPGLVQNAIEGKVEGQIEEAFSETGPGSKKESFDQSMMTALASEGLAEAIARKVLVDPEVGLTPDGGGRSRYLDQFWQMIILEEDKLTVWYRPTGP